MTTTKWTIDPMHSEVQFKIKHLVISTVTGSFKKFDVQMETLGDGFEQAQIQLNMDVASIDTNQEMRDKHLVSSDFFDAEHFPQIQFSSTSFEALSEDTYKLHGLLTMKGVTREVSVNAEYGGFQKDAYGNVKHGFEINGKINRKDFGLTYNSLTETGGLTIGEEVKLMANIQLAQLN